MKVTTCGGCVVVINIPRVVVVNLTLAGFVELGIGLFKFQIFLLKPAKIFDRNRRIPTNFQPKPTDFDGISDSFRRFPMEIPTDSVRIWAEFAAEFRSKSIFLKNSPCIWRNMSSPPCIWHTYSVGPHFLPESPSKGPSHGHPISVGTTPTKPLFRRRPFPTMVIPMNDVKVLFRSENSNFY